MTKKYLKHAWIVNWFFVFFLFHASAFAQNSSVILQNPVTPGHQTVVVTNGILKDAGSAFPPTLTARPGVVSNNQQTDCIYNAAVSGPYSSICTGITSSGAYITLQNNNGGPALPLNFVVNGAVIPFPGPAGPFLSIAGGTITGAVNSTIRNSVLTLNGNPFLSAPMGSSFGSFLILGENAGLGISSNAIEATIIGQCAGGSQCRGGSGVLTGTEDTFGGWFSGTSMTTGSFNTGWGVNTMGAETVGHNLTAIGNDAMRNPVGLTFSVAVGDNTIKTLMVPGTQSGLTAVGSGSITGNSAMSGSFITAIGDAAVGCGACTTASFIVGIGDGALLALTSGHNLTFAGSSAGRNVTTLVNSVGIGDGAIGTLLTTGTQNGLTAVGSNAIAGNSAMAGSFITAVGTDAVQCLACTSAANIVGVGDGVLTALTTGGALAFVGSGAGASVTSSINSTGMGAGVMSSLTTGGGISGFGFHACGAMAGGNDTSCFGQSAGVLQIGSQNTFVGSKVASAASGSGQNISAFGYEAGLNTTGGLLTLLGSSVAPTLTNGTGDIVLGVDNHADVVSGATSNVLIIQGAGTTATISATLISSSSPAVTIPGTLNVVQGISANGNQGISATCVASGATLTITNGLVTAKSGC